MSDWKTLVSPANAAAAPQVPVDGATWQGLATPAQQIDTPDPELSASEKGYRASANRGWLGKIYAASSAFNDQADRALSMGLSDKIAALSPAVIHGAAKGVNALYNGIGADVPFPEAEGENFSDIYHANLAKERGAGERYSEEHPYASAAAKTLGTVASIPMTMGAGELGPLVKGGQAAANAAPVVGRTLAAKVGTGIKQGAGMGAVAGFGQSNDESLAKDAIQTGIGAGVGGTLGAGATVLGEKLVSPIANWVSGRFGANAVDNASTKQILDRISKSAAGGGPTAQDMLDLIKANAGKPLNLVNAGGEPVKGLGERIISTPGAGRQIATTALDAQDAGAGVRIGEDLTDAFGAGKSNYSLTKDLSEIQRAASAPAYEKAFQGGSTAPLEDQFRQAVQQATSAKSTIARQIKSIETNSPGALAARGAAGAETRAQYMSLQNKLQEAETNRVATLERFKQAQADKTANAPGAVWSPKLQEFLDDPIMKPGIQRGLEIQRLETVGTDTPFNPTEHAIIGTNPDGSHIVGAVPNMRLADAGKRGLDAMIADEEVAPGQFTERGKALIGLKTRYVDELKKLNPDYEPALKAFSGPASSKRAVAMGEYAMTSGKVHPDAIADQLAKLDPGDQELYRLGAMNALKTQIGNATPGANEALKVMGTDNIKKRITAIAGSPEKAEKLINSANIEHLMKTDNTSIAGNSRSALRLAEQESNAPGGELAAPTTTLLMGASTGEPGLAATGAFSLAKKLVQRAAKPSPEIDAATARKLFSGDAAANQNTLAQIMALGGRPSMTPLLTRPFVQGGAQALPQALNMQLLNRRNGQ